MKCPWLITTITQTDNKNSYTVTQRTELQTFSKCVGKECPFYRLNNGVGVCGRANPSIFTN